MRNCDWLVRGPEVPLLGLNPLYYFFGAWWCRRLYTRNIGASLTGTNKIGNRTGEPF